MICKIADFVFEFKNASASLENFLKKYKSDTKPEFLIKLTDEDIEKARTYGCIDIDTNQAEINACQQKVLSIIPLYDAFFLHSSLIEVNDIGIAFTALSGTGKTTHTLLWQKLLGDKIQIINGDKPIIRFKDGIPYGYGTPWCGKERLSINKSVPLKHLCFIERSERNSCEKISAKDSLKIIFSQIFIPKDATAAQKTLELLDRLLKSVDIWIIKCNTDISAAQTTYNAIFKGE